MLSNYKRYFLLFLVISFGAASEYQFISIFSTLSTTQPAQYKLYELIMATSAPLMYLTYYFLAFHTSIEFCNKILKKISRNGDLMRDTHSVTKQLTEDYILCHEQLCFPTLLLFYRFSIIVILFIQALLILFAEIGFYVLLLILLLIIIVLITMNLVKKVSKSFAKLQIKRSRLIDALVASRENSSENNQVVDEIASLNGKLYLRRLLVNAVAILSKPITDFFIMVLIVIFVVGNFSDQVDQEVLIAMGLIFYRSAGPFITMLNSSNQIQFGWQSLSDSWTNIIKQEKLK